jgi:hypothetical protein
VRSSHVPAAFQLDAPSAMGFAAAAAPSASSEVSFLGAMSPISALASSSNSWLKNVVCAAKKKGKKRSPNAARVGAMRECELCGLYVSVLGTCAT